MLLIACMLVTAYSYHMHACSRVTVNVCGGDAAAPPCDDTGRLFKAVRTPCKVTYTPSQYIYISSSPLLPPTHTLTHPHTYPHTPTTQPALLVPSSPTTPIQPTSEPACPAQPTALPLALHLLCASVTLVSQETIRGRRILASVSRR